MKDYFTGKSTRDFAPELPPGVVEFGEKWVASSPISIPNRNATCLIVGKFDSVIKFDNGGFGVLDFKTSETKDQHVPLYGRQLHSYAWALENPAPGKFGLTPVTRLGLVCVEPNRISTWPDGDIAYGATASWIECPRDDEAFLHFLCEIVGLLERPEPPEGSADCVWCQYRNVARRIVA